jgi:hypothetical protein
MFVINVSGRHFQPSMIFFVKSRSLPIVWVNNVLHQFIHIKLAIYNHTSLFRLKVSDEGKKLITLTPGVNVIKI